MAALVGHRKAAEQDELLSLMTPLNQLPLAESWVKEGILEKQVVVSNIFWKQRRCCLTSEFFAITRPGSLDIMECIPLKDIQACDTPMHLGSDMADSFAAGPAERVDRTVSSDLEVGGGKLFGTRNLFGDGHQTSEMSSTIFQIRTIEDGYNSGRTYSFRASSNDQAREWVRAIHRSKAELTGTKVVRTPYEMLQNAAQRFMGFRPVQWLMEGAIVANFILSVVSTQVLPESDTSLYKWLEVSDWIFLVLFTVELFLNILAQGFLPFWHNGWNIVDAFVVAISLISKTLDDVPNLSVLRLIRVFRVVRLFNKLRSLRSIIESLSAAVLPVFHAFMLLLLVSAMYAVIGVHLYKDKNPIQFGNFAAALFTMFQVCTGDGWATTVVRPMFGSTGEEHPDGWVTLFFVSYILIVGTFLINVVVAVLLDEFLSAMDRRKREYARAAETAVLEAASRQSAGALDPLLVTFSGFNTAQDLSSRIRKVYQVLDADDSGGLNYAEMKAGMRRLKTEKPVHLSAEDWDVMTEGQTLCDENGELNVASFEIVMRRQLKLLVQRHMAIRMSQILFVLKQMMLTINEVEDFIAPENTPEAYSQSFRGTISRAKSKCFQSLSTLVENGRPVSAQRLSKRLSLRGEFGELDRKLDRKVDEIGGKLDALVASLSSVVGKDGKGDDRSRALGSGQQQSEIGIVQGNGEAHFGGAADGDGQPAAEAAGAATPDTGSAMLQVTERAAEAREERVADAPIEGLVAEERMQCTGDAAWGREVVARTAVAMLQVDVREVAPPDPAAHTPDAFKPLASAGSAKLRHCSSLPSVPSVSSQLGYLGGADADSTADVMQREGSAPRDAPAQRQQRHSFSGSSPALADRHAGPFGADQHDAGPGRGGAVSESGGSPRFSGRRRLSLFGAMMQSARDFGTGLVPSGWSGPGSSPVRSTAGRSAASADLIMGGNALRVDMPSHFGHRAARMGRFHMS